MVVLYKLDLYAGLPKGSFVVALHEETSVITEASRYQFKDLCKPSRSYCYAHDETLLGANSVSGTPSFVDRLRRR
jgi:hypothetical protein